MKQIKIGGHTYKIIDISGSDAGRAFTDKNTIAIDMYQSKSHVESTLLHEILHILNNLYDLNLTEAQVAVLETALYDVIKNNKLFK